MGKASRDKGAAAEREVAAILADALGVRVQRQLGQARDGGADIRIGRFVIECKRQETLSIPAWHRQLDAALKPGEVGLLVYRRSREPWRVSMALADFLPYLVDEMGKP